MTPEQLLRSVALKYRSSSELITTQSVLKTLELLWNGKSSSAFKANLIAVSSLLLHELCFKHDIFPSKAVRSFLEDDRKNDDDNNDDDAGLLALEHDEDEDYFEFHEKEEDGEFLPFLESEGNESIVENGELKCYSCDRRFETVQSYEWHVDSQHISQGMCHLCGKQMYGTDKSYIRTHINVVHRAITDFKCSICGKLFADADYLQKHHKRKHEEEFKCKVCLLDCMEKREFERHIVTHTNEIGFCTLCGVKYEHNGYLRLHMDSVHQKKIEEERNCQQCGKQFRSKCGLEIHFKRWHRPQFKCELCNEEHPNNAELQRHYLERHGSVENSCLTCKKAFTEREFLIKHVGHVHSYKCPLCRHHFGDPSSWHEHMTTIHSEPNYILQQQQPLPPNYVEDGEIVQSNYDNLEDLNSIVYLTESQSQFSYQEIHQEPEQEQQQQQQQQQEQQQQQQQQQQQPQPPPQQQEEQQQQLQQQQQQQQFVKAEMVEEEEEDDYEMEPKCYICNRIFDTKPSFKEHIKEHSKNGICHICGKKLASGEDYVKIHIKTVHENKTDYKCDVCGKCFGSRRGLELHGIRKHLDEFKCKVCQVDCVNKTAFHEHIKIHASVDNFCHICGILVSGKSYLKVHIKTVHENNTDHKCDFCGKCFGQRSGLKLHMERWHSNDPLNDDAEKEEPTPVPCPHCDKTFNKKSYLKVHIRTVHDKRTDHRCDVCGRYFAHKQSLLFHIKRIHEQVKDRTCDFCGKLFGDPDDVKTHVDNVHKKVKVFHCDHCEFRFPNAYTLQTHVKIVHMKVKDFQCDTCGRNFGRPADVRAHIKLVHKQIKDYMCETCGKYFGREMDLLRHIQSVHQNMKNYQCQICSKFFALKHNLNKHVRVVHEKSKDYECEVCHKLFGLKGTLQKHVEGVHEGRRDAKCDICGKCFSCRSHVKRHTRRVHSILPSQQPQQPQQPQQLQQPPQQQLMHHHLVNPTQLMGLPPLGPPPIHTPTAS